jgi:hypothetical protein
VCAFWVRPGRVQRAEPLNILTQIPAFHKRPGASRSVSQDQSPGSRVRQRCGSTLCLYLLQLLLRDKLWLQIFLEIWLVLQLRAEIMIRVAALQDEVAYGHRLCPGTNPLDGVSPWRHVDDLDVALKSVIARRLICPFFDQSGNQFQDVSGTPWMRTV